MELPDLEKYRLKKVEKEQPKETTEKPIPEGKVGKVLKGVINKQKESKLPKGKQLYFFIGAAFFVGLFVGLAYMSYNQMGHNEKMFNMVMTCLSQIENNTWVAGFVK